MAKELIETKLLGTLTYDTEEGLAMDKRDATFQLGGQDITIDLDMHEGITLLEDYQSIAMLVEQFPKLYAEAKTYLLAQMAEENGTIEYYFEFHLEELTEETLAHLKVDSVDQVTNQLLIENLILSGAWFSLDKNNGLELTFDFKLVPEFSDELLVVRFDRTGKILYVSHES
ncbi:DUF2004 domain-containing protein [Isobaculum melis]|uniref:DUF2004 domain-containing protein n=1 Tax=Isobaculum melis TaxID=142588 RepID=A0A1H9RM69_9LACT|nr:DUF2004 domain-containing protein [Isobaculum melis]SER73717.1 Protein of unknown function [Isobaculum melis]